MTELAQRHLCHLVPLWCHFQAECLWTAVDVHDALRANGCEPLFVRVQRDSPGDGGWHWCHLRASPLGDVSTSVGRMRTPESFSGIAYALLSQFCG